MVKFLSPDHPNYADDSTDSRGILLATGKESLDFEELAARRAEETRLAAGSPKNYAHSSGFPSSVEALLFRMIFGKFRIIISSKMIARLFRFYVLSNKHPMYPCAAS